MKLRFTLLEQVRWCSIYIWLNAVTNSRDNVALRSFFSFTVSGLYAPNCSDSVIAEVLAQECCLHNFNQF